MNQTAPDDAPSPHTDAESAVESAAATDPAQDPAPGAEESGASATVGPDVKPSADSAVEPPSFADVAALAPEEALEQEHAAIDGVEQAAVEHAEALGEPLPDDPDNPAADLMPDDPPAEHADDFTPALSSMLSGLAVLGRDPVEDRDAEGRPLH